MKKNQKENIEIIDVNKETEFQEMGSHYIFKKKLEQQLKFKNVATIFAHIA